MEIAKYVKELLYNHDLVIIPGIGGIRTQYVAANIRPENHTITPPSKVLAFDPQRTESDGLLANYIAQQKKLPLNNANDFVKTQAQQMLSKLDLGNTLHFEGFGYFSKENNVIRFEQEHGTNYLTTSYGLSDVAYQKSEIKLDTPLVKKLETAERPQTNEKTIIAKKKSILPKVALWALVLVASGIGIYVGFPYAKAFLLQPRQKASSVAEQSQMKPSKSKPDSVKDTLESVVDQTIERKNALALPSTSQNQEITYYIIAGSFKTAERAKVLVSELEAEGAKPTIIQFSADVFRVSLGEFKNKQQALVEMEKIRAVKGADAVWLFKKLP